MKIWIILFMNCTQNEVPVEPNKFKVTCESYTYKEDFKNKKACEATRKEYRTGKYEGVDSTCMRVTVWRK